MIYVSANEIFLLRNKRKFCPEKKKNTYNCMYTWGFPREKLMINYSRWIVYKCANAIFLLQNKW